MTFKVEWHGDKAKREGPRSVPPAASCAPPKSC